MTKTEALPSLLVVLILYHDNCHNCKSWRGRLDHEDAE